MTREEELMQRLDALYSDRSLSVDTIRSRLKALRDRIDTLLEALVQTDEERDI